MMTTKLIQKTLDEVESDYREQYMRGAKDCHDCTPALPGQNMAYLQGYSDMYTSEQINTNRTLQSTH